MNAVRLSRHSFAPVLSYKPVPNDTEIDKTSNLVPRERFGHQIQAYKLQLFLVNV